MCCRPRPLYERAKRVDSTAGEPADRTIAKHKLDGSVQSANHSASHDVLRERGEYDDDNLLILYNIQNFFRGVRRCCCFLRLVSLQ